MTWLGLASFAQNTFLTPLHLREPRFADGDAFALAAIIPHGAEGQRAGFFLEGEAGGVVAAEFGGAGGGRFEQREEQGARQGACADDPCGDAGGAGVRIVEAEGGAAGAAPCDELAGDGL